MGVLVKWLKIAIIILVVLFILAGGSYYYYDKYIKVIPEELIKEALQKTLATESYRYHVKIEMKVDNRSVLLSDLQGEKANSRDFHIWGAMQDQQIEVYQINNITYMKDSLSSKWLVIPENPVFETEYFMAEINPLSSFIFTNLVDLQYLGREKVEGKKIFIITCKPEVNNEFLTRFWKDFEYKLWIEGKSRKLVRAEVKAKNKAKQTDSLNMVVDLKDYNAKIILVPPVK